MYNDKDGRFSELMSLFSTIKDPKMTGSATIKLSV
jgi:hypothetical protein